MKSWFVILPRVGIAAAALLCLGMSIQWAVCSLWVDALQAAAGAQQLGLDHSRISLLRGELQLNGLAIGPPSADGRPALFVEQATLQIAQRNPLSRPLVVEHAELSGVVITPPQASATKLGDCTDANAATISQLLTNLTTLATAPDVQPIHDLASVELAECLTEQWPAMFADFNRRIEATSARLTALRQGLQSNPAETGNAITSTVSLEEDHGEIDRLQQALDDWTTGSAILQQQASAARQTVANARDRDLQALRAAVSVPPLDPESLSDLLLAKSEAEQVRQALAWFAWASEWMAGDPSSPNVVLQSVALDGLLRTQGGDFPIHAVATNLASQPRTLGKPTTLRLTADEPSPLTLEAVFDRTGVQPHDRIVLDCPAIAPIEAELRGGALLVRVAPERTQLHVEIQRVGDQLSGRIVSTQAGAKLTPKFARGVGDASLNARLQQSAASILRIETVTELSGAIDKPIWTVRSTLGPQLAMVLHDSLQQETSVRREQIARAADALIAAELTKFDRSLADQQQATSARLKLAQETLAELKRQLASRPTATLR